MKANLATIEGDNPRATLVECLNRADTMRSVVVLYVTNDDEVTISRNAHMADVFTMHGMLTRFIGRMED